ncbi:hypothetical protein JAAARDRAFT_401926 [Jaapia argillacea MUCL 33604]|uniref:Uncharacterized protein n=1 Tax=Jaapia argillacea MUCL 33604 TaxID=933084 RepID=A0A067PTT8_9AGAM|nr:hypothetical protein JAAARDRAFT_401926 [Jaapia argillacea MUCL 33604]
MNISHSITAVPAFDVRVQSIRILLRLRAIPETKPWFSSFPVHHHLYHLALWEAFSLGAPLCILLELLGAPSFNNFNGIEGSYGIDPDSDHREKLLVDFIQRVRLLEIQGRLPYGEAFRAEDLLDRTISGFMKVLRVVERVLRSLEETYPGLYVFAPSCHLQQQELVLHLLVNERAYVNALSRMTESVHILVESSKSPALALEVLTVKLDRLLKYHYLVLENLERKSNIEDDRDWNALFLLNENSVFATACAAHRSYCADYLNLDSVLETLARILDDSTTPHVERLHQLLSLPPRRFLEYLQFIEAMISLTNPMQHISYYTLAAALATMQEAVEEIEEIGMQVRTIRAASLLRDRSFLWDGADPDTLGLLLLGDELEDHESDLSVMMFEELLVCCRDAFSPPPSQEEVFPIVPIYPIPAWELGPALKRKSTLNTVYSIPTRNMSSYTKLSDCSFELTWAEDGGQTQSLTLYTATPAQCSQWCLVLHKFASETTISFSSSSTGLSSGLEDDGSSSLHLSFNGRGISRPKPWSLVGRKGPHSESSSMIVRGDFDHALVLSPTLLPSLFIHPGDLEESEEFSLGDGLPEITFDVEPESPQLHSLDSSMTSWSSDSSGLVDITGQIHRDGQFPLAHGGFADVWKGTWRTPSGELKVAVKVLRKRTTGDPDLEEKLQRRLRRELNVWRRLNHENIVPLYGVADDFGPYVSMVCPWLENGSVSKYLERHNDLLSLSQRLQLLSEVCCGLSYLHSFSIIHGDLTGSNILLDHQGKACLCDFGLSSVMAEFQGTSCFTSNIGGAVRWAAIELYRVQPDGFEPTVSIMSDIYSFGSVMLEVLSGKIPYYYFRSDAQVVIELNRGTKPARPTDCPITDAHWHFIRRCWADDPEERPCIQEVFNCMQSFHRMTLAHRRNTN